MIFPNVPNVPGVPALPRLPGAIPPVVQLLVADVLAVFGGLGNAPWGLFLNGLPVVTADTVTSFDFKASSNISSFPVEQGGFESYNKVQKPFDVRMRFATGGSAADRQELLESVAAACNSLDLMDAVSPEAVYESVNPVYYDYRRTAVQGVGLLVVDVFCEEVRVRASSSFTSSNPSTNTPASSPAPAASTPFNDRFNATAIVNPQSPGASPQVNGGTVQPIPTTTAQQTAIDSQLMLGAP